MDEMQLIERYFRQLGARREDVLLGIGDDAALLTVPSGCELALTTDALVEGAHFLPGADARSLGHRALAVNLSDIAAMGAAPGWMLLSLVMPEIGERWLSAFCAGLGALAARYEVALVGGNLARGPLSITVELAGFVPRGQALRRSGAQPGDDLYVSGAPGDAAAGRRGADDGSGRLLERFEYPTPRVALGQALRGLASACIDVSDGLYVDARRMLMASGCGGALEVEQLPISAALGASALREGWPSYEPALLALSGGEDYELCFCAPPAHAAAIGALAARLGERLTRVGGVREGDGLMVNSSNRELPALLKAAQFDHFGA